MHETTAKGREDGPVPARISVMSGSGGTFAGYRLEQLLLHDTVSTTYRAISQSRARGARRPVALRITHPLETPTGPDTAASAAFIRALTDAVAVEHPALAVICDAGEETGRAYVATELVAAITLEEHLRHHGPLTADDAVGLLLPVADALDALHDAGVTHGAISPRTIQVTHSPRPVEAPPVTLTGIGIDVLLARQVRDDRSRVDIDDVCYVAPEQLGGHAVDGRADQYALACALYHCVAGRAPFVRDAVAALFGAHLFSEARIPPGRDGDRDLAAAVATGMAKRPVDRHASCVELMRATGHLADAGPPARPPIPPRAAAPPAAGTGTGDTVPGPPQPGPPVLSAPAATRRRRRIRRLPIPWPAAAILVLAGIICTLALAAVLRDDADDDQGSSGVGRQVSAGPAPDASGDAPDGQAAAAAVEWQRGLGGQPIRALGVAGDVALAATADRVYGLDAGDGTERWSNPISGAPVEVVAGDGVVGVRTDRLRGLSPGDGAVRWESGDLLVPGGGAVAAADDAVYGIRHGQLAPEVVAFDAVAGTPRWRFDGGGAALLPTAAVAAGGGQVAVLQEGTLFGIDVPDATARDGATVGARWTAAVTEPWTTALTVVSDAAIVATREGQVCAYGTADGAQLWCARIVGMTEHEPRIVAAGDVVTVVMRSHVAVLALESGALEWVYDPPHDLLGIAAGHGPQVVVVGAEGTIHGLDVMRRFELWQASGLGTVTALTSTTGALYAGTEDSRIVRLSSGGVPVES